MGRKTRGVEKVENLYRTARAQNDSINTSEQFRSRLRYAVHADRTTRAIERRAPQDEGIKGQFDE